MSNDDLAPEKTDDEQEKFEVLLQRLEKSVRELEDGELSLDDSLKRYVEAVEIYRRCRKLLDEARRKVEILLEDTKGKLQPAPFELDEPDGKP